MHTGMHICVEHAYIGVGFSTIVNNTLNQKVGNLFPLAMTSGNVEH